MKKEYICRITRLVLMHAFNVTYKKYVNTRAPCAHFLLSAAQRIRVVFPDLTYTLYSLYWSMVKDNRVECQNIELLSNEIRKTTPRARTHTFVAICFVVGDSSASVVPKLFMSRSTFQQRSSSQNTNFHLELEKSCMTIIFEDER